MFFFCFFFVVVVVVVVVVAFFFKETNISFEYVHFNFVLHLIHVYILNIISVTCTLYAIIAFNSLILS